MFLDWLIVAICLFVSALIRFWFNPLELVADIPGPIILPWILYALFPTIWVGVLWIFSVYDGRKNLRVADEYGSLSLGSMLAAVAMAGVLYFTYRDTSRFLIILFIILTFIMMLSWRGAYRLLYRYRRLQGADLRNVLILGAGENGKRLHDQIQRMPLGGLNFVGFLDDDALKCESQANVLGPLDAVRDVVNIKKVDDVVVALPRAAEDRLNKIVSVLHDLPVKVWVIPDYFSLTLHKASVEDFAGIPMLDLRAPALSEYQRITKRAFDLILTLAVMPFALPLMAVAALMIYINDRGPVFFRQRRVGENGKIFFIIKFRTMVMGAEKITGLPTLPREGHLFHKTANDPRVTRVGKFLRRTSIDELPQLFNILRGEMSWVGPRPEMPALVEKYEPWQRKRFTVPQGLTGWWQINGRSNKPMHLHTEDDLYYVQHYSIWLDLQILLRTIWVVIRGDGAF